MCEHARVDRVESNAGALLGFQCSSCNAVLVSCKGCGGPLAKKQLHKIACTKCPRGKRCPTSIACPQCMPAGDVWCVNCRTLFTVTGLQSAHRKAYCTKKCRRQAYRLRRKERHERPADVAAQA